MRKRLLVGLVVVVLVAGWFGVATYRYTNQIEMVFIQGVIYDFPPTVLALDQAASDANVKAIVLYMDTPGGLAYPCIEIAKYVDKAAARKPVLAAMGSECASGGYYIASFADKIVLHENTITSALGVITVWVDMSKYYEEQGIKVWVWSTGEEKDLGASWRSPTEEEKQSIQTEVDSIFQTMLDDVQKNRNLTVEALRKVKTGSTFSGREALELGLADEIGSIRTATAEAAETAGLIHYIVVTSDMDSKLRFLRALWLI